MMRGPNASVSRWATPAVGSSRQQHPGVEREQAGELDDAAGAGRQVGDVRVGVAAEAEEVDELVGLGAPRPLHADRRRQAERGRRGGRCGGGPRARPATVSRTVSSGNSVAAWNVRPRPAAGPRRRRQRRHVARRGARPCPCSGTKPPIAFISVVLPAPLVPISPTISSGADLDATRRRRRAMPPKRTRDVGRRERGHAGRRAARARSAAATRGSVCCCLAGAGPMRRSTTSRSASRAEYAIWTSPPGK